MHSKVCHCFSSFKQICRNVKNEGSFVGFWDSGMRGLPLRLAKRVVKVRSKMQDFAFLCLLCTLIKSFDKDREEGKRDQEGEDRGEEKQSGGGEERER